MGYLSLWLDKINFVLVNGARRYFYEFHIVISQASFTKLVVDTVENMNDFQAFHYFPENVH